LHPFCADFEAARALRSQKISLERAAQLSFLKSCLLRIFVDANWSAHRRITFTIINIIDEVRLKQYVTYLSV
jgi:hypothetical protein